MVKLHYVKLLSKAFFSCLEMSRMKYWKLLKEIGYKVSIKDCMKKMLQFEIENYHLVSQNHKLPPRSDLIVMFNSI